MKRNVMVEREVDIKVLKMQVPVRYDEEDIPNDFPFREGDMWNVSIDVDSGRIIDWPKGQESVRVYMKVCDEGYYFLYDSEGELVGAIEENYVPDSFIPGEYGDYIDFQINENGTIINWYSSPSIEEFTNQ